MCASWFQPVSSNASLPSGLLNGMDRDQFYADPASFAVRPMQTTFAQSFGRERSLTPEARKAQLRALFERARQSALESSSSQSNNKPDPHAHLDVHERPPFEISVVFLWVEDTPAHRKKRAARAKEYKSNESNVGADHIPSDNGENRYANFNELRYAIRSVQDNLPWVSTIYVVTDPDQCPGFLNNLAFLATPIPVFVVPHTDVFAPEDLVHLPCFNSQAIESNLHRIPGLSSHFIYFNDDMFVGKPLSWRLFFGEDGLPCYKLGNQIGLTSESPPITRLTASKHMKAWRNNLILLARVLPATKGKTFRFSSHQGTPMRKEAFELAWRDPVIRAEFARTTADPFRGDADVYPIGFLMHYALQMGAARVISYPTVVAQVNDNTDIVRQVAQRILREEAAMFCINDCVVRNRARQGFEVETFLEWYFPTPSTAELEQQAVLQERWDAEQQQQQQHVAASAMSAFPRQIATPQQQQQQPFSVEHHAPPLQPMMGFGQTSALPPDWSLTPPPGFSPVPPEPAPSAPQAIGSHLQYGHAFAPTTTGRPTVPDPRF